MLSIFPPLGQSIALQSQMDGSFQMLPIKLYPSFVTRHKYKKVSINVYLQFTLVGTNCESVKPFASKFKSQVHENLFQIPHERL